MTTMQKVIKYLALAFAAVLAVSIIGGIISAVGLFSGLLDNDAVTDEMKTYDISEPVVSLDIVVGAADFTVEKADSFRIVSNLKNLRVTQENGTLIIEEATKFATYNNAKLTLYIPEGTVFDTLDITTGAGRLTADALSAKIVHLVLGAGEVNIGSLTAETKAEIEGGAGKLTISGGLLKDLDLEMGVGQLNLAASLPGSSELELGVGESNLTLIGSETEYAFEIEKGIGSLTVNGQAVTDFGSFGSGANQVEIHGGIGAIHLNFRCAA